MIDVMNSYYDDNYKTLQATTITEGGYYIAYYDSAWYRIRAVSSSETDVHCFFIDFGDETVMKKENVFQLQREFASSQAQVYSNVVWLGNCYICCGLGFCLSSHRVGGFV